MSEHNFDKTISAETDPFDLEGEIKASMGAKDEYLGSVSEMRMLIEGANRLVAYCKTQGIETIFFLDKSARPAAHLFRHIWDSVIPDTPRPAIKYINIGRRGFEEDVQLEHGTADLIQESYQVEPGTKIAVMDELVASGGTLVRAKQIMSEVYPDNEVTYGAVFDDLPNWYGDEAVIGVKEASISANQKELLFAQRLPQEYRPYRDKAIGLREHLTKLASIASKQLKMSGIPDERAPYIPSDAERITEWETSHKESFNPISVD